MKSKVKECVLNILKEQLYSLNSRINSNRIEINNYSKQNEIYKRSRYELTKLIREVKDDKE